MGQSSLTVKIMEASYSVGQNSALAKAWPEREPNPLIIRFPHRSVSKILAAHFYLRFINQERKLHLRQVTLQINYAPTAA
jgi:hypothetical protein